MDSSTEAQNRKTALAVAERAVQVTDKAVQRDARRIMARINAVPMAEILAQVPGDTMLQKAAAIGVTKTAVWYWHHGYNRPRSKAAKRIAKLTGLSVAAIRGLS